MREIDHPVKQYLQPPSMVLRDESSVEDVLYRLRQDSNREKMLYCYVVDDQGRLLGTVGAKRLLTAKLHATMHEIMDPSVIALQEEEKVQKARELLVKHRLIALPVVDPAGKLQGVVDIQLCLEEEVDFLKEQRKKDVFQWIGVTQTEILHRNPFRSYTERMPWIFCNMIGGIACAGISLAFKDVLAHVIVLAMFIPLVLSISESISMQSMTHSLQLLRKGSLSWRKIFLALFLEMRVALLMSWTSGLLIGGVSFLWDGRWGVSVVIAVGILLSVIFAGALGSFIPLFLHEHKLDPKVASGPIVLTLADIVTTVVYFFVAAHILGY